MPYMSIELMQPSQPPEHWLEHDLESMLLVILHIACFTCGPTANLIGEVKSSFTISLWHHEPVVALVMERKKLDIFQLRKDMDKYITKYWHPIAPYLSMLIDIIYPGARFQRAPILCRRLEGESHCHRQLPFMAPQLDEEKNQGG